jgi:hypothetical protein
MASFWAQHGYGKSDKIDRLKNDALLEGIFLSPGDEEPAAMRTTVGGLQRPTALLDPQTYVYSMPGGTARCHGAHGLDFSNLNWGMPAAEVEALIRAVVHANDAAGIDRVIAPTPLQRSLGDVWTSLSLQMARTTLSVVGSDRSVYVSVVIDESALDDWQAVENWLNVITQLDAHGFYLVIARTSQAPYPAPWAASRLVNYLRLIYSLAVLNGYEVLLGYADVEGALGVASGAQGAGSGWYYSLRSFSEGKWRPSGGGRQPNPRAYADGLLTPVLAVGEGEAVARSALATEAFPEANVRDVLVNDPQSWSLPDSWLHHLQRVATLTNEIGALTGVSLRLDEFGRRVDTALTQLATLSAQGIPIATAYRPRLLAMRDGLRGFRAAEGV